MKKLKITQILENRIFTINSKKYDETIHRSWNCDLVEIRNSLFIFRGVFQNEVVHPQLGVIRRGTVSTEYFWLKKWFNIFKFESPEGEFVGFYCNTNLPPIISADVLDFVDLDLDVFVDSKFNIKILDEDEFKLNSAKYQYPPEVQQKAQNAIRELIEMIERRDFPFDISL